MLIHLGKKKSVTVDMAVSNFHSALFLPVNDLSGDQIPIFSEISLSYLSLHAGHYR